ncbi:MAG: phosphotransferase enzyme family protein [Devosia sp.]
MPLTSQDIEPALLLWPALAHGRTELVNHSENQTFRIDTLDNRCFMLRVHRMGYQSARSVQSELDWLQALQRDTDLPIPDPVPGDDGKLLQTFVAGDGTTRMAVLFRHIAGSEPEPHSNLSELFGTLGDYAARLHQHASAWQRPAGFERQSWQATTILDRDALWGDWRVGPGVNAHNRPVLDRLNAALQQQLIGYGHDTNRYGLIHADMRLGNLLIDGQAVSLIDFDDCGFCWFTYDFAAAISFHETNPAIPALKSAWLERYRAVRALDARDIASIDGMVMLRRMALLAWIGSHAETSLAQLHAPGFADGTAALAERFLAGPVWPV